MATRTKGPWNHKKCAEHHKVEGYTAKVCVLPGQDGEQIVRFAEVMYRLATAFRRRILKPAVKRRQFDMHDVCGGHYAFPGMGKVCYGRKGMSASDLTDAKAESVAFTKDIAALMQTNPRYARFYTGSVWK